MFPKISVIIPAYWANNELLDMTTKCLKSLEPAGLDEVLLVDDGSPIQAKLGYHTTNIRREENGGYAAAVNTGLAQAIGEILIVANNDLEFVDPHWLHHLTQPLKKGYDISSIRTTDSDGWETRDFLEEGAKFGSLWAMKREVYSTIGGLDETYGKGYFEDLDYLRRAEEAGFKVVKNHNGLVEHKGKATFKVVDPKDTAYHESMGKFIQKWGKDKL